MNVLKTEEQINKHDIIQLIFNSPAMSRGSYLVGIFLFLKTGTNQVQIQSRLSPALISAVLAAPNLKPARQVSRSNTRVDSNRSNTQKFKYSKL